ncbi:MAG: hypothetical protein L6265_06825, partial [Thermoplasmatales archaeon]|nr:hypothetical protein [Thermoplasmatales archaeon]
MKKLRNQRFLALSSHNRHIIPCAMKKVLLIVFILLCSSFIGINHDVTATVSSPKTTGVNIDRISTTIEIEPMSSGYFYIENNEIKYITQEKIPVMDALKRVPNWLRDDLEKNFEKMAYVDIDVGEHAAPALFDIDDDNDFDLVVGRDDGKILVYENINNAWVKKGFLNDSNNNPIDVGGYAVPTFFDLYNDGNPDLIVGAFDGKIRYYENTTEGFVYKGYLKDNNKNTIDVGSYSAPAFANVYMTNSIDTGNIDLIIGADDGDLHLYENTGNNTTPIWTSRGTLGGVLGPRVIDYSKPTFADMNDDDLLDLTIGDGDGKLHYYENTGSEDNAKWASEDTSMYANFETCAYATPFLADMDKNKLMTDDCLFDVVVGRGDGHIHLYKNVGTSSNPRWDVWSKAPEGVEVEHHMKYRNLSYVERYTDLILDVENEYVDEIAFCIAHTSVDVLTDDDVYLDVFKKNAELIYEINESIQYANLVEEGNISTGDYWTTIRYNYSENGDLKNTTLPPDIYYWFVVHPKITDEIPTFINPETGRPDESGVFWREYLFYHADENYPSDPDTDTNNDGIPDYYYPKDEKPPLLKDKISNITVMYDNVPYTAPAGYDNYGHNNERPWNYTHAVEVVSNWVEKTLPLNEQESDDGERPIQPVRIAHHHNGNCGELQDLTVAAARTCMIPAAGVSLIGEDHVWSEFYCLNESGDYHWHQWDNYWSDGGSVIDNFDNYWVNWGHRGGSGISKWWGDDHITDVTGYYVPTAPVTKVVVNDADGNPVDGAKVVVSSYWLADNRIESIFRMTFGFVHYVPGAAVPGIWGYTDSDGTCEFRLVGNFTISVSSKIGSDEETNVYIGEKGKTATRFDYGILKDEDNVIKWEMDNYGYPAGGDIRNRENINPGGYIYDAVELEPGIYTLHYITDRTHAYNSWVGKPPEPDESGWSWSDYFGISWGVGLYTDLAPTEITSINNVGNNADETEQFTLESTTEVLIYCIGEWGNKIEFTLDDTVAKPALNIGGHQGAKPNYKIELEYNVLYDEQDADTTVSSGLVTFEGTGQTLKTGRVNSYIDFFTCSKENMTDYLKGQTFYSNLSVLKTNERSNTLSFYIDNGGYIVFSNDKSVDTKKIINVTITLKRQQPWSPTTTVDISTNGFIQGSASSAMGAVEITEIKIRVDDNDWMTAWSGSQKNVAWNYSLNMTQYYLGKHTIYVKVTDKDRYSSITAVEYTFACLPTAINIASPKKNEMIEKTITVSGTASDINIIQ